MTASDELAPAAPPPADAPAPVKAKKDKPIGAFRALGVALTTTGRNPFFYILTVVSIQLVLVLLAVPLLQMLYSLVLVETGLGSVAYDRIAHVLTNPLADLTLLVLAGVAVVAVFCEFTLLFVLASHHQAGEETSLRDVFRQVGQTLRKLAHPQGLLIVVYLLLLLPLGQFGLSSTLTKKIAVPPFVSGELMKSASTSLIYSGVLLVLFYVNLRLVMAIPLLATTSVTVWQAFVTSWRMTRWRTLRIIAMLVLIGFITIWPALLLLAAAMAPTVIADFNNPALAPIAATTGLSLWQIGGFVLAALLTITLVQGLTAMKRDWLRRLPERHQPAVLEIPSGADTTVTKSRKRTVWIVTAVVAVIAFGGASVINYGTMTRLANSNETAIIGHRGWVEGGVENTIPALIAADRAGADRNEFDVLQTKDLKFVVMHDSNLQRLAGIDANVKDLTLDELTKITVRADGMEAKIPSLAEWITESKKLDLPGLLEVKLHGGESPDLLPRLLAQLDAAKVTTWFTYHSISRDVVEDLKRLRPELVVGFIVPINFGGVPIVNCDFLVIEQASYSDDFRNEAWGKGYKVVVWTVDEEDAIRGYVIDNINGIITDQPKVGVEARDAVENEQGLSGRLGDMLTRSSSF